MQSKFYSFLNFKSVVHFGYTMNKRSNERHLQMWLDLCHYNPKYLPLFRQPEIRQRWFHFT